MRLESSSSSRRIGVWSLSRGHLLSRRFWPMANHEVDPELTFWVEMCPWAWAYRDDFWFGGIWWGSVLLDFISSIVHPIAYHLALITYRFMIACHLALITYRFMHSFTPIHFHSNFFFWKQKGRKISSFLPWDFLCISSNSENDQTPFALKKEIIYNHGGWWRL